MTKTILTMSRKEVELERIKLINQGLLADSSHGLDLLIEKLTPKAPEQVHHNLYIIERG